MSGPETTQADGSPSEHGLRDGVWLDGSVLIERYVWTEGESSGVQWLVSVVRDGAPRLVQVCASRRRAAEWLAEHPGRLPDGV